MNPSRLYGLIGYPVKHSLSPAMHNAAFKALGINAEYKLFEVVPSELEYFLERSKSTISGFNVTIPYKEAILDFVELDEKSFYLRQVRAVNTIVHKNGVWKGFNTDIPGFQRHLKEQCNPVNKRVALLGAGGGAKAVSYVLAKSFAKEITIFDIDNSKAEGLVAMIKSLFGQCNIYNVDGVKQLDISNKDLLINATPIGLKDTDPCLVTEEMLHRNLFVYDLIYNPPETKLLSIAKRKGAKVSNGLGMLLYQGARSFYLWTKKPAPLEIMKQSLNQAVKDLC